MPRDRNLIDNNILEKSTIFMILILSQDANIYNNRKSLQVIQRVQNKILAVNEK